MNSDTGKLYGSRQEALDDGTPESALVMLRGDQHAVDGVARAVRQSKATQRRRARNKAARRSRKRNR